MMSTTLNIKNPEVPGLECLLPPPPPPPPPPNITVNESHPPPHQPGLPTPVPPPSGTFGNVMPAPNYYANILTPIQTHSASTPWWIPTDADSSDVYAHWYATSYKAGVQQPTGTSPVIPAGEKSKSKPKFLKRKSEAIDPRIDAEKVATAQRELSALMKPLKCDLCNAVMNSTLQAKRHYDGKPHQKKVSMFLNQNAKKLKADDGQVTSTTGNDWNSYCEICKTWFTSQMDAAQHYAGKKHIKAAHGLARPSAKKKAASQAFKEPKDPTGRFGVGVGFQKAVTVKVEPVVSVVPEPTPVPVPMPMPVPVPVPVASPIVHYAQPVQPAQPVYPLTLHCEMCGVSTNREDQLETHKRGARHLRMLKLNGLPVPETVPEVPSGPVISGPIDYSIYRTPSGQYYCAPCNLSLNSEITFAQHIESKKHKNQVNPKVQTTPATPSKKSHKKK
ncbi:zinc finger protein 385B-like [Belonocnema kinseyi]|uniref:zinc finger protein 385B-like n=1 Tax=Belonocnema kinseyi TaxID=2817044 RepID=UPI00143D52B2|nr:zinc finger protein 385B-like [Belonocnema kinseyi]